MKKLAPLLVLPWVLLLAHCSDTQSVECPCGQQLNADGTDCVPIPCEGGDLTSCACVCPGDQTLADGICTDTACIDVDCDDSNECTADDCQGGNCSNDNVADDTTCDAAGSAGLCKSGMCEVDRCVDVDCTKNECRTGDTCNTSNGECEGGSNAAVDTSCDQDGGKVCDGAGNCVECNGPAQCTDGMECTDDLCDTSDGSCSYPNVDNIQCDGGDGVCENGTCAPAPTPCVDNPCLDDTDPCTNTECKADGNDRTCEYPTKGAGVDCGDGKVCDIQGDCVGCLEDTDCPPDNDVCTEPSCDSGVCGNNNPANEGGICTTDDSLGGTCMNGVCDPGPPQIESFLPTGNDVEPDATITAEFDRAMNGDTINETTFTLETSNGPVLGIVTYDALTQTATFTPDTPRRRLTLNVQHTAKLSADIQDMAGRALASDEEVGFRVRDGEWSQPVRIDNSSAGAEYARVGASADGHAVVVWSQAGVYWVRLKPSGERSPAALLALSSVAYDVGMDDGGNAIAIHGGANSDPVVGQRLLADQSNWGGASELSSSCNSAGTGRIAVTPAGRALAVWSDSVGGKLCGAAFTGTDWEPAQDLDSGSSTSIGRPKVAVAPDGRGFAVWSHEFSTSDRRIMAHRYTGSAWAGSTSRLDKSGEGSGPAIALDSDGNAMAGWQDTRRSSDGNPTHINFRRYVEDPGDWLDVVGRVDNSSATNFDTQVAADAAGNFVFLWGEAATNMRARLWRAGDGQLADVEQITSTGSNARDPHMVLEPNGTGLAMWYREDGTYMGSRFRPGIADWEEFGEEPIYTVIMEAASDPRRPRIAIRPDGTAVAVWAYYFDVFMTEFE